MLFNEEVSITLGNKVLIKSSQIQIQENEKYVILGPNGVGKTSLANYIYDKIKDTNKVLYVTQTEKISDDCTVFEYMIKTDLKLYNVYMRHKELEEIVSSQEQVSDEIFNEYTLLSDTLKNENFEKYTSKVYNILNGLGFVTKDTKINSLSGGQQTKLSLARALLLEWTLILDEPSNNLDLANVIWLQDYLSRYKNTLIVISHNIRFFDHFADKIIFFFNIDPLNPQVFTCKGGYSSFAKLFDQKRKDYIAEYEKYQKKVLELKKKNTPDSKTKLEKLQPINRPIRDFDIKIRFNDVKLTSSNEYCNVVSFDNVSFGYTDKPILIDVNIGISMKSRYILMAENGSGKTTFFKLCTEKLTPTTGIITRDHGLRIGYFNQDSIKQLNDNTSPVAYIKSINPSLSEEECRKTLAKIGFKKMYEGDNFDVGKLTMAELSGGQKVKLVLCGIQIQNPHILLFDEVENHLDIHSINEFIEAVNEFNGGVVIITHDQYTIENIENYQLLLVQNNTIKKYNGTFEDYIEENFD
jgi:ATP-binding cassette subfamily F protein 1